MNIKSRYFVLIFLMFVFSCLTKENQVIRNTELDLSINKDTLVLLSYPLLKNTNEFVKHNAYSLAYSEKHEQAFWVQYTLFKSNLELPQVRRTNNFQEDPKISSGSATLQDYKKSGYDRGHLAPCADFTFSEETMNESFFMSNMSPQNPSFNRGKWKTLEEKTRKLALEHDSILVITGPVLHGTDSIFSIGEGVTIPNYFYKLIISLTTYKSVVYLMPNKKLTKEIDNYIISIDILERIANIDFLYPDSVCIDCNEESVINYYL